METHLVEMQKRLVDLQSERDLLRSQLKIAVELIAELVRLKDLKDTQGKSMEYEVQKLKAWKEAREVLSAIRKAGS